MCFFAKFFENFLTTPIGLFPPIPCISWVEFSIACFPSNLHIKPPCVIERSDPHCMTEKQALLDDFKDDISIQIESVNSFYPAQPAALHLFPCDLFPLPHKSLAIPQAPSHLSVNSSDFYCAKKIEHIVEGVPQTHLSTSDIDHNSTLSFPGTSSSSGLSPPMQLMPLLSCFSGIPLPSSTILFSLITISQTENTCTIPPSS